MTRQEQMFALIEESEQSQQTIAAFCAARDLRMKTFFYWRKKFLAARSASAGFIPIVPPTNDVVPSACRLSYPNGVSLHLPAIDLPLIAQLIRLA